LSAIDDLPPLREVIRRHGLRAKKSLGQNFLLDLNLTARIARAAGPLDGLDLVEIGPGPGGLTRALLAAGARRVIAVERDDRAIAALAEIAERYPGRLEIVAGDALEFDPRALIGGAPARVIANLPYNIATALLVSWLTLEPWPPWYDRLVLMFQREVAERIVAAPGSKTYGRLSVLAGWRCKARILFDVAGSAFVPPPKVTSSLVDLVPREQPLACERRALERVTEAAFGQRRKMLRQSLRSLGLDATALLEAAGIEPTARAEDIPVEGFVALARALSSHPKDCPRSQFCLQTADKFGQSRLALALEAFGRQNRLHLRERAIDIGIDDHVVVLGPVAHLVGGLAHARMDDLIGVLRSRSQPQLEVRNRRRQHEDADEIAICLLTKLLRALPVDVEQNVAALDQSRLDWQPGRAIAISEHLRPFQQFAVLDHCVETRRVEEMVVAAVDLARPLLARRHRNRKLDARVSREELARQRGLAGPRGRGQHQHEPAAGDCIRLLVTTPCRRHGLIPNSAPARGTVRPHS
jgi:16S rRNA (adenine1518-N6/adenine1519-N6)-dimethyltransferase